MRLESHVARASQADLNLALLSCRSDHWRRSAVISPHSAQRHALMLYLSLFLTGAAILSTVTNYYVGIGTICVSSLPPFFSRRPVCQAHPCHLVPLASGQSSTPPRASSTLRPRSPKGFSTSSAPSTKGSPTCQKRTAPMFDRRGKSPTSRPASRRAPKGSSTVVGPACFPSLRPSLFHPQWLALEQMTDELFRSCFSCLRRLRRHHRPRPRADPRRSEGGTHRSHQGRR